MINRRIFTVEEANNLFCPHMGGRCVSEGCMLWEWYYVDSEWVVEGTFGPKKKYTKTNKGYCSLGGKE